MVHSLKGPQAKNLFGDFPCVPVFCGNAEFRQAIVGQAKIEQMLEGFRIAKERPVLHRGAALSQGLKGAVEPDGGPARFANQLHIGPIGESPASQGNHGRFGFQDLGQRGAFDLTKEGLARSFKYLANRDPLTGFDNSIEVDERPLQFSGKKLTDSGFAAAHEPEKEYLFASVPAHALEGDYSSIAVAQPLLAVLVGEYSHTAEP